MMKLQYNDHDEEEQELLAESEPLKDRRATMQDNNNSFYS